MQDLKKALHYRLKSDVSFVGWNPIWIWTKSQNDEMGQEEESVEKHAYKGHDEVGQ